MKKNSKAKPKQQASTSACSNSTSGGSSSSSSSITANNTMSNQISGSSNTTAASYEENASLKNPKPILAHPMKHNNDLVNIFNKILQFQADKSEWEYYDSFKIVNLSETIKSNVIEKSQMELRELESRTNNSNSGNNNQFIIEAIQFKLKNLKSLSKTLHDLTLQLKHETEKENQLNLQKAKLTQNIDISSTLSLKLQESCRQQQKRNKKVNDDFITLCQEEKKRNDLLKQSCENNINDVILSVNNEEELLLKKENDNKDLQAKIIEFQHSLNLRKKQIDAYSKAIDIQNQINHTKMTQIMKNKANNVIVYNTYQNRIQQQLEKNKYLHQQTSDYSHKFVEFEKMLVQTRDVFHQVENRGKEITTKAYNIEVKNQTIFSKAELKQKELESLLNRKVSLDQLYRSIAQECRDEESKCRQKQTERSELIKKMEILKAKYPHIQLQLQAQEQAQTELTLTQTQTQEISTNIQTHNSSDLPHQQQHHVANFPLSESSSTTERVSDESTACCVAALEAANTSTSQSLLHSSSSLHEDYSVPSEAYESSRSSSSRQLEAAIESNTTGSISSSPNRVTLNSSSSSSSSMTARRRGGGTITVGDDPECEQH